MNLKIKELFADYDGIYETEEIDWGEDVGNEIYFFDSDDNV